MKKNLHDITIVVFRDGPSLKMYTMFSDVRVSLQRTKLLALKMDSQ